MKKKLKQDDVNTVIIDFAKVNFFSRSFIDEFLNGIDALKKKEVRVQIKNMKPPLKIFLNRVRKTKNTIRKEIAKQLL